MSNSNTTTTATTAANTTTSNTNTNNIRDLLLANIPRNCISCDVCGKTNPKYQCLKCYTAYYCSSDCLRILLKTKHVDGMDCHNIEKMKHYLAGIDHHQLATHVSQANNVKCGICTEWLYDPIVLKRCHHAYCTKCLQNWNQMEKYKLTLEQQMTTTTTTKSTASTSTSTTFCPMCFLAENDNDDNDNNTDKEQEQEQQQQQKSEKQRMKSIENAKLWFARAKKTGMDREKQQEYCQNALKELNTIFSGSSSSSSSSDSQGDNQNDASLSTSTTNNNNNNIPAMLIKVEILLLLQQASQSTSTSTSTTSNDTTTTSTSTSTVLNVINDIMKLHEQNQIQHEMIKKYLDQAETAKALGHEQEEERIVKLVQDLAGNQGERLGQVLDSLVDVLLMKAKAYELLNEWDVAKEIYNVLLGIDDDDPTTISGGSGIGGGKGIPLWIYCTILAAIVYLFTHVFGVTTNNDNDGGGNDTTIFTRETMSGWIRQVSAIVFCTGMIYGLMLRRFIANTIFASSKSKEAKAIVQKEIIDTIPIDLRTNLTGPQQRHCYMQLIHCYYELGNYDTAIQMGSYATQMNRHFPGVHEYIAKSHLAKGDMIKAQETMYRAVLYETPWDIENIAIQMKFLKEILNNGNNNNNNNNNNNDKNENKKSDNNNDNNNDGEKKKK